MSSAFTAERLRNNFFPWALAFVTGLDYFDNTLFTMSQLVA